MTPSITTTAAIGYGCTEPDSGRDRQYRYVGLGCNECRPCSASWPVDGAPPCWKSTLLRPPRHCALDDGGGAWPDGSLLVRVSRRWSNYRLSIRLIARQPR